MINFSLPSQRFSLRNYPFASRSEEWYPDPGYGVAEIEYSSSEKEKEPVTVICALRDGENLFLAADSSLSGLPVKTLSSGKIETFSRADARLAWACSGDETIGDLFSDKLKGMIDQNAETIRDMDALGRVGTAILSDLNGVARAAKQRIAWSLNPENDFAQVLIAAYIAQQPEIIELGWEGDRTYHLRAGRNFTTIGGGRYHAAMAYEVLRERNLLPQLGQAAIKQVVELVARYAPNCKLPVKVVRVTPSAIDFLEER